jgi:hypothetical protein
MREFQQALANMPAEQRRALFRMFPEPKEPPKLPQKITRRELLDMWQALEALLDMQSRTPEFAYAIVQNRAKMRPEIKKLDKAHEPPEAYKLFDAERLALCMEHAKKDAHGKPLHDGERYVIPEEQRPKFEVLATAVRDKHAEAIAAYKVQADKYDALLDGEVACPQFVFIPARALPPTLTARQLEPLALILE